MRSLVPVQSATWEAERPASIWRVTAVCGDFEIRGPDGVRLTSSLRSIRNQSIVTGVLTVDGTYSISVDSFDVDTGTAILKTWIVGGP